SLIVLLLLPTVLLSQTSSSNSGTFTDPRDGSTYRWVKIGDQTWMAENLRYKPTGGSWCWNNEEESCKARGRLYNWAAALQAAPPGWHLPSDDEWKSMEMAVGLSKEQADLDGFRVDPEKLLAGKIKLEGVWPDEYEGSPIVITNESGFSAIKTGFYANDEFTHDPYTGWWSSTESDDYAWIHHIGFFDNTIGRVLNRKVFAFPVRCVKDHSTPEVSGSE
ncbi:MAG: FISUMP domain-containing protein, partial [bacterium]